MAVVIVDAAIVESARAELAYGNFFNALMIEFYLAGTVSSW
jgi:hypothetical protein